ncbi:MAG: hypothetical protein U9O98_10285 [Asgard group archaeon]|nr:hypothetical protein [Asgard group archaeon]
MVATHRLQRFVNAPAQKNFWKPFKEPNKTEEKGKGDHGETTTFQKHSYIYLSEVKVKPFS